MSQDSNPSGPPRSPAGSTGGPMAERMQALLSRAAEEQLTEQRQVSTVLNDLRQLVAGLGEQLRGTASSTRLDSLGSEVAALVTELRTSTTGLGERLDAVGRRLDDHAAATTGLAAENGAGALALEKRVAALGSQVTAGEATLVRLTGSLSPLSAVPGILATVQSDVSAMQSRLEAVGDGLNAVAEVAEVRTDLRAVRDDVEQLAGSLAKHAPPTSEDVASAVSQQISDHLVDELAPRLAELVATRVSSLLVEQVATAVTTAVQSGLDERVRAATGESELRINAHVDEAILALAEALLRRRRSSRGSVLAGVADTVAPAPAAEAAGPALPEHEAQLSVDAAEPASADTAVAVAEDTEDPASPAAAGGRDEAIGPAAVEADGAGEDAPETVATDDAVDSVSVDDVSLAAEADVTSEPAADLDGVDAPVPHEEAVETEETVESDDDEETDDEETDNASGPSPSSGIGAQPGRQSAPGSEPTPPTPPARISARTALDELLAGRQAWGYKAQPATASVGAGQTPAVGPHLDASQAPAPSSHARQTSSRAPASPEATGTEGLPSPEGEAPAGASTGSGLEEESFDDEQDGPRRRPWWRPGG